MLLSLTCNPEAPQSAGHGEDTPVLGFP